MWLLPWWGWLLVLLGVGALAIVAMFWHVRKFTPVRGEDDWSDSEGD